MGGPIRLLASGDGRHAASLAHHLAALQAQGPVIFVTVDRPHAAWSEHFQAAGVDETKLGVVDLVSSQGGMRPVTPQPNVMFVASPTMLEMASMRVDHQASRLGAHHVVVDSVNALALHNGPEATQAFAHYLVNRLRGLSLGGDLVVRTGAVNSGLEDLIAPFVDSLHPIPGAPP